MMTFVRSSAAAAAAAAAGLSVLPTGVQYYVRFADLPMGVRRGRGGPFKLFAAAAVAAAVLVIAKQVSATRSA